MSWFRDGGVEHRGDVFFSWDEKGSGHHVAKALLVVLCFMHVRYSSRLTWVFVGAGVFWMLILIVLTMSDILTRQWLPVPPPWGG